MTLNKIGAYPALLAALRVIVRTPGIRAHLEATDPKALAQAEDAIRQATGDDRPRHSDACTEANDRSAREVCICREHD